MFDTPEPITPGPIMPWRIAIVWLIIGVSSATQVVVAMRALGMHHHWVALFLTTAAGLDCLWAVVTPLILYLSRRFPAGARR